MSKYLALLDQYESKLRLPKAATATPLKTLKTPFEGFEGEVSRSFLERSDPFEGFEGDESRGFLRGACQTADIENGQLRKPSKPSKAASDAEHAVAWLRSQGVAVTLSEDRCRPVLSGERAGDLPQEYISRLMDLSCEIVELLYEERKTVRADRQRYKNSEPWNWPEDLNDAIRIATERNKALESRRETARYCLCQKLAENEWTTKRGRVWVCEPCRDDGLLNMLQDRGPSSKNAGAPPPIEITQRVNRAADALAS